MAERTEPVSPTMPALEPIFADVAAVEKVDSHRQIKSDILDNYVSDMTAQLDFIRLGLKRVKRELMAVPLPVINGKPAVELWRNGAKLRCNVYCLEQVSRLLASTDNTLMQSLGSVNAFSASLKMVMQFDSADDEEEEEEEKEK
jgi:hypothetical protein